MGSVTSTKFGKILAALACACLISLGVSGPSGMSGVSEAHAQTAKKKASSKKTKRKQTARKKSTGGGYSPPYAALVVDAKTGKVLHADNADAIRHPASLTKVMTLYVLFDELERGSLTLNTPLKVSSEASRQAPSKLGLKTGDTIRVEDAIKALVTKSANDAAVVIAENISGTHSAFAQRMTRKARALGMNSTVYHNANGLPDTKQVTTARDLAILGRAIQDNHPGYFKYFGTRSFTWRGQTFSNHNRLLGNVRGVDGIKTGFVRASGFNLLTSAKDDGREVVAVVLGGRSSASRDARMRELVQGNIVLASSGRRTAPKLIASATNEPPAVLALASDRSSASTAIAAAEAPAPLWKTGAVPVPAPRPSTTPTQGVTPDPVLAALASSQPAPVTTPAAIPAPPLPVAAPAQLQQTDVPLPVLVERAPGAAAPAVQAAPAGTHQPPPEEIARRVQTAMAAAAPSNGMRWVVGAQPTQAAAAIQASAVANAYAGGTTPGSGLTSASQRAQVAQAQVAHAQNVAAQQPAALSPDVRRVHTLPIRPSNVAQASVIPTGSEHIDAVPVDEPVQPAPAVAKAPPPGWMIQIGATPDQTQALGLIDRASKAVKAVDRDAEPYTETVEKDGVTLYRARFAGLNERSATAACRAVKRDSLSCFTLKN